MFGPLLLEAIHSTALEHPGDCKCDVCAAAHGDREALVRVMVALAEEK